MPDSRNVYFFSKAQVILISVLASGLAWYLSTGLHGDYWWLVWIAPIPILLIIPVVSAQKAFWIAFCSYLIGRLSWVTYLNSVLPLVLVIIFTLILPLVFAVILLATRKIILQSHQWAAFLCFPVLYTGFEWIYFQLSRDGTAGSLAYSQADCLPFIQIASIAGVTGITFIICFIPALLAAIFYCRLKKKSIGPPMWLLLSVSALVFIFGFTRIYRDPEPPGYKIGMIVMNESLRKEKTDTILNQYAKVIDSLVGESLQLILLPEKIASITNDDQLKIMEEAGVRNHTDLIIGISRETGKEKLNQSLLLSGNLPPKIYTKVNLYEGESYEGFVPGHLAMEEHWKDQPIGLVVCKDMDFDRFIRQYKTAAILFVPAWDFVRDDWLHSRMAIIRGVENGFSIARNARQGRLTISDCRGKILEEKSSADGREHVLIGTIPAKRVSTIFSSIGNIFGMLNIIAVCWVLILVFKKREN
jgi:apolipoprotein N-acyltransferase